MKAPLLICAAAALSTLALPASARESAENTVIVRYADLNLSDDADRATLKERVDDAVNTVCKRVMTAPMEDLGACSSALRAQTIARAAPEVQRALSNRNVDVASATRASD